MSPEHTLKMQQCNTRQDSVPLHFFLPTFGILSHKFLSTAQLLPSFKIKMKTGLFFTVLPSQLTSANHLSVWLPVWTLSSAEYCLLRTGTHYFHVQG